MCKDAVLFPCRMLLCWLTLLVLGLVLPAWAVDTTPPTLTVPGIVFTPRTDPAGTPVNLGTATATDDTDPNPTITNDAPALFPLGTTLVTWTATDASGNVTRMLQRVTVYAPGRLEGWGLNNNNQCTVPNRTDFVEFAAGGVHTVAIKQDGSLIVWGSNANGQFNYSSDKSFVAVAAGKINCVALRQNGSLVSWGGQTSAPAGTGYVAIAAGAYYCIALKQDGSLIGWGLKTAPPRTVPAGNDFVAVAGGDSHAVAIKRDGSLYAWGANDVGQCIVPAGTDYIAVAAGGAHSVALRRDGSLVAWGADDAGQCEVPAGNNYVAVDTGNAYSVALTRNGQLVAWGSNSAGQCVVPYGTNFAAVSAGDAHGIGLRIGDITPPVILPPPIIVVRYAGPIGTPVTLDTPAITDDTDPSPVITNNAPTLFPLGTTMVTWTARDAVGNSTKILQRVNVIAPGALSAWGANDYGQCTVPSGTDYVAASGGNAFSLALKLDGSLIAWGNNQCGQCNVPAGTDFVAVSAGFAFGLALRRDGSLVAWGSYCTTVPTGNDFVAIAAGTTHSVALKRDGTMVVWGEDLYSGQANVPPGPYFVSVAAGSFLSAAIRRDSTLVDWCNSPSIAPTDSGYVAVSVGQGHRVALKQDGTLIAWGNNNYGQCNVPIGSDYVSVSAGSWYSVAAKRDGTLVAWGSNSAEQCNVPSGRNFVAVYAGSQHALALRIGDVNPPTMSLLSPIIVQRTNAAGTPVELIPPTVTDDTDPTPIVTNNAPAFFQLGTTLVIWKAVDAVGNETQQIQRVTVIEPGKLMAWGRNTEGQCNVPSGADFVAISAGGSHNVALRQDGSLVAWGLNTSGQCNVPTGNDYLAISAGGAHTVALKRDGSLMAWGLNTSGECNVPAGTDFVAVKAGQYHNVALKRNGSLVAWGLNTCGQSNVTYRTDYVAMGVSDKETIAVRQNGKLAFWGPGNSSQYYMPAGTDFIEVVSGATYSIAKRRDGSLAPWGENHASQCNIPIFHYSQSTAIAGATFIQMSAGMNNVIALRQDGSLVAWGSNTYGQCTTPKQMGFVTVAVGDNHCLAIRTVDVPAPSLQVPGIIVTPYTNPLGTPVELGTASATDPTDPNPVITNDASPFFPIGTTLVTWTAQNSAGKRTHALQRVTVTKPGFLTAWGYNIDGQCNVPAGTDFIAISAGDIHAVALKKDGSLAAWGSNISGQTTVPLGTDYVAISSGYHSVALKRNGQPVVWGAYWDSLNAVPSGTDYVEVVAGERNCVAIKRDGSLVEWGDEYIVPPGNDYVAVSTGISHSIALKQDGSLVTWGRYDSDESNLPMGTDYVAIAAGGYHSLALKRDGSLVAWGRNDAGQCMVPAGNDFIAVAAGDSFSIALKRDGSLVAWGKNDVGQCNVPAGNFYRAIAAGNAHAVALADMVYQPDLQIKGPTDADFKGAHAYNDEATQTTTATTCGTTVYHLLIGNDGNTSDSLTLTGPAGEGGWSVRYFDERAGGGEITAEMTGDGWPVTVGTASTVPVRVEVTADATIKGNAAYTATVSAVSVNDGTKADYVVATATKLPLQKVTLTGNLASAVLVNTPVTFTASTEGGGTPEFKFRIGVVVNGVTTYEPMPPAYTPSNTFVWTPTAAGTYIITVYAREQGTTALKWMSLTYTAASPLSALALTVTPPSPQQWDHSLTATVTATGGVKPEYRFKACYRDENDILQWVLLRDYASSATWTGKLPQGIARTYTLYAYAREQGTTVDYLLYSPGCSVIIKAPLSALAMTVTPTSPQPVGGVLTVKGLPTGGAQLEYQFKATYTDATGALVKLLLQDYCPADTWTGKLPLDASRIYTLYVYAREQGTTLLYLKSVSQAFSTKAPLTTLAMSVTPASPQPPTSPLTVKALPTGGSKLEYAFKATYLDDTGTLIKLVLQDYGLSDTWTGTLPQDAARAYTLYVYAREQGTTVLYLKSVSQAFTTNTPLTALGMSVTPASPQPKATTLTMKALPTGGNKLEFAFKATYTDATGALVKLTLQDYSASATWTGQLPQDAARAYTIYVYAREQGTTVTYLKSVTQAFTTK